MAEFKTCKYIVEAIVSEGIDKGEVRKICAQADCPIHHPKNQNTKADASFKSEQDKRRREEALANAHRNARPANHHYRRSGSVDEEGFSLHHRAVAPIA